MPLEIEGSTLPQRYYSVKGATHGLSHTWTQMEYFRPGNRHPHYKNLYFVGASTHPALECQPPWSPVIWWPIESGMSCMDRNWQNKELYEIRIKGHLASFRSETFDGMQIYLTSDGETTLRGIVIDQAALHGLLARIRDLNLTLISVNRVESELPSSNAPVGQKDGCPDPGKA